MDLTQIAAALGVSRSAAFRAIYTLESEGYLIRDPDKQAYLLGPMVLRLGYGYLPMRETVEVAQPVLERLRDSTGWSAQLAVLDGVSVLYVLRRPATGAEDSIVHVGSRLPARSTSLGRVLLAALDEDDLMARFRRGGARDGTVRPAAVLAQAHRDRGQPWVLHLGDFQAGIASVAAPVRDREGQVVAAISLSARHTEENEHAALETIVPALVAAATEISTLLGSNSAMAGKSLANPL